ncbi:hypothetical protein C9374_003938 [Naegleria lovaniensis]|uniref:K Homology domain-containing protein n=1 Tax=Naegleria lovaniensis TaxID=51637 RepID=A0AA88H6B7_NAELO|nr:uncharacterized protein C9374_003938 [Naegleria lovaniensis]KAG2394174.1 hypothetical protein C9374_003938 [Naegleria lovaniensis]
MLANPSTASASSSNSESSLEASSSSSNIPNNNSVQQVSVTLGEAIRVGKEKKKHLSELNKLITKKTKELAKTVKQASSEQKDEMKERRERLKEISNEIKDLQIEIDELTQKMEAIIEGTTKDKDEKLKYIQYLKNYEAAYETALIQHHKFEDEKSQLDEERSQLKLTLATKKQALPCSYQVFTESLAQMEATLNNPQQETPQSELKQIRSKYNKLKDSQRLFDEHNRLLQQLNDVQKRFQQAVKQLETSNKTVSKAKKDLERAKIQYEPLVLEKTRTEDANNVDELNKLISKKRKIIAQLTKEKKTIKQEIENNEKKQFAIGSEIKSELAELTLKRLQVRDEVDTLSTLVRTEIIPYTSTQEGSTLGRVIGKKGATLENIRKTSNCEITIVKSENQIVIKGAPENVTIAKEEIQKLLEEKHESTSTSIRFKLDMFVPLTKLVSHWRKETSANIYLDKLEGVCKIVGSNEQVKSAKKLVNDFLTTGVQERTIQITKLGQSHEDMVELLFGVKGENLKRIQNLHGVIGAQIDKKNNLVKVHGTNFGVENASKLVNSMMKEASHTEIQLENATFAEALLNSSDKLQQETKTIITVVKNKNIVRISGYKQDDVKKAKQVIEQLVEKEKEHQRKTQHKQTLSVENKVAQIFKKKASSLSQETDTIIKISNGKPPKVTVFAETPEKVQHVIHLIQQEIEKQAQIKAEKEKKKLEAVAANSETKPQEDNSDEKQLTETTQESPEIVSHMDESSNELQVVTESDQSTPELENTVCKDECSVEDMNSAQEETKEDTSEFKEMASTDDVDEITVEENKDQEVPSALTTEIQNEDVEQAAVLQ